MSHRPSAFTVVFQVPATDRYDAFETRKNVWASEKVRTPEDAIRDAYAQGRRSYQCTLHDDLHKAGRIVPIPGYDTQVILHPHFDLQVVRVEATSEVYSGGGMALVEYRGENRDEFTRESVPFSIRRDQFDAHCYDETGALRFPPLAKAA
jgi:hypothetical protein